MGSTGYSITSELIPGFTVVINELKERAIFLQENLVGFYQIRLYEFFAFSNINDITNSENVDEGIYIKV